MASMNIEMRLNLVDTASAQVKGFMSSLEALETAVASASDKMASMTASMRSMQSASRTLGNNLPKVAEGISAIGAAAGTAGQVNAFAAGMEKLAAALGLVKESSAGVGAALSGIGNRAGGASLGTFKLEQTLQALAAALEGITGKLNATATGMAGVGTAAGIARAEVAGAMTAIGNSTKDTEGHVKSLANTLVGTAQIWAAFKIEKGLKTAVSDAAEYERTDNRLRNMKLSPEESDMIHQSVRQTGRDFHQFDQNELLEMAIDLRNATGSAHEAAQGLKGFAQSVFAINLSMPSGKKLDEQGILNFAKFLEGRGVTMDPAAMAAQQDLVTKITAATQGRVNPTNLFGNLTYAKGGLGRTMDDEALVTFAAMIEQDTIGGGSGGRVGTMLTSFVNSITKANAITTKNRDEWLKLGLVDPGKVNVNPNTDRVTSIQAGAIAGTDIVGRNFKKWVDEYLRPALVAQGVNMDDLTAVKAKTDVLFPNRNASEAAFQLLARKDLIEKDAANINQAAGKDEQVQNGQKLSAANWERFHKAINDLAIAIGTALLPVLNPVLELFTKIIEVLGHLTQDHPVFAALLGLTAAFASLRLLISGITLVFGPLAGILGVVAESFGSFGAMVAGVGGMIAGVIPVILRFLLRLAGPIGIILLIWDAGLGDWISKLNVFGHSVGDWASSLADKVVTAFKNMWVRTKAYFGFLSDDAANAQIEANNRASNQKQGQLGFGSRESSGKITYPGQAPAKEGQTPEQKRIADQIAKNKAGAAGLLGDGGKSGGRRRFANYDADLDAAKNDLRLEQDELRRHMDAEDELYKAHKISIAAYYDDKLATMRKSINAQIAELERERAAYQRQGDRAGVNRTNTEIELRRRDLADTEKSVAVQREKDLNALKEKGLQLDAQQLEAEGKKNQAHMAREIQRLNRDKQEYLLNGDTEHADRAQQAIDTAKLTQTWEAYSEKVKKVQEDTQTKEVAVNAALKAGNLTKFQAEQEIFRLRQQEAAQLDELIAKERALIEASDAPRAVKDQRLKTLSLAQAKADATLIEMSPENARIKQSLDNGVQGGFSTLFQNVISGSKSAKAAFQDFGNGIVGIINRLVSEQLGRQLFESLFGKGGMSGASGGGVGLGGLFGAGGWSSSLFSGGSMFADAGASGYQASLDALNGAGSAIVGLATGTDNVPQDMLAMIHQGEMIIPKYDAERLRAGQGGSQRPMHVYNNFTVAGNVTRETQSQIALQAGLGVSRATRRNG